MAAQCRLAPCVSGAYSLTAATPRNGSVSSSPKPLKQRGLFLMPGLDAAFPNSSNINILRELYDRDAI